MTLCVSNFSNLASNLSPTFENFQSKIVQTEIEKVVSMVSRTGRDLQLYDISGHRQVVGCIPYRYKKNGGGGEIEVLLISAQKKGKGMLIPKGGWEIDESIEEAALRETFEEAGVTGKIEETIGKWQYKSNRHSVIHHSYIFPMLVSQQFELWPEAEFRQRKWVCLSEAMQLVQSSWMREALEAFINRKCQE